MAAAQWSACWWPCEGIDGVRARLDLVGSGHSKHSVRLRAIQVKWGNQPPLVVV